MSSTDVIIGKIVVRRGLKHIHLGVLVFKLVYIEIINLFKVQPVNIRTLQTHVVKQPAFRGPEIINLFKVQPVNIYTMQTHVVKQPAFRCL